jgi:hypothetical protein
MFLLSSSRLIRLLAIAALLQSCGSGSQSTWHGFVYFASGPYLGRLELKSGTSRVVANLGDAHIQSVYNYGSGRLLLRTMVFENGKDVPRIFEIDIGNGRTRDLFTGGLAAYLEDSDTVVYDDGDKLLAVPRGYGKILTRQVADYRQGSLLALMAVGGNRVLYELREDMRRQIWLYDYGVDETQELVQLASQCTLDGAVWIARTMKLACREQRFDSEYMLASLDGEEVALLGLPEGRRFRALAYAGDQNIVLLSEKWDAMFSSTPRSAVWVLDLGTGKAHRLLKHQFLGDEAAYLPR